MSHASGGQQSEVSTHETDKPSIALSAKGLTMNGKLAEFTLAQLLQFFALAERSGSITVNALGRESRLIVEGDRIIGWGHDDYDVRSALLATELLAGTSLDAIRSLDPRLETPGLSFVVRNLIEPDRWEAFAQRQLEQDVYPLLTVESGEFDVVVGRCPPAPLRISYPINSLILDGSRWESEMEAAQIEGYTVESLWQRDSPSSNGNGITFTSLDWVVWTIMTEPQPIAAASRRLGVPDLEATSAVRRLHGAGHLRRL